MSLVDLLVKQIDERGQEQVAMALEVKQSTVSRWAAGAMVPDDDRIGALAELFGVSEDQVAVLLSRARRAKKEPVEPEPAFQSKLTRLTPEQRKEIEAMVDRLLGEAD